jgi:hypothetical protein
MSFSNLIPHTVADVNFALRLLTRKKSLLDRHPGERAATSVDVGLLLAKEFRVSSI